ncbi:Peptide deformylase, mitochondrial [Frankliniella fusca]|uniref:Peptide deformylase n=1 Tax=Frankliniella fusca TaxID=407009 RepID=A0AAE1HM64_9NEOP|nr:Peptide deformylase, mitochondrial [Frankliniella fusca]
MFIKLFSMTCVRKCYSMKYLPLILRRHAAKKSYNQRYKDFIEPAFPKPPFNFICQIGDPVLRQRCDSVDESLINTSGFQDLIAHLWKVHEAFSLAGLAAPQIGLPLQLVVIGFTETQCKESNAKFVSPVLRRVLINPVYKVLDYKDKITDSEGCASVCGYSAQVSRYSHIQVEALNENGIKESWKASGFEARTIQHEVDHLQGVVFVDKMEAKSLECSYWQHVKLHEGKGYIEFGPGKRGFLAKLYRKLGL